MTEKEVVKKKAKRGTNYGNSRWRRIVRKYSGGNARNAPKSALRVVRFDAAIKKSRQEFEKLKEERGW